VFCLLFNGAVSCWLYRTSNGKVHSITRHEGTDRQYRSVLFL